MKVCFVINEFSFFLSHRLHLIQELSKFHEISILTDLTDQDLSKIRNINNKNIKLKNLKKRRSSTILSYFIYLRDLKNLLDKEEYEKVFFITLELSFLGSILLNLPSKRDSIFVISGIGPFFFNTNFRHKLLRLFHSFFFRVSKNKPMSFIFQNINDQNLFIELGLTGENKSSLIKGNGVQVGPAVRKKIIYNSELKFLFAGRLSKSKGILEYIEAGKILFNNNKNIKLVIAGNYNPEAPDFYSKYFYEELKDYPFIDYLGHVEYEQMTKLYNSVDVFVIPSYREGLPKSALEAAASGLPIIASDAPGCRECVKDNGYLTIPRDRVDLASKMEKFIKKPEIIYNLGTNSQRMIDKEFSLNKISKQYLDLIR